MIKHVLRPPRLDFVFVLGQADPKHGGQLDGLAGHADDGLLYSEKLLRWGAGVVTGFLTV